MKKYLAFLIGIVFLTPAKAQQAKWVLDREKLLTPKEINRIDSVLQRYHERTGKFIIVCTDTADITAEGYAETLYSLYNEIKVGKSYVYMLLLSRKNQQVNGNVSKNLGPYINMEKLISLMEPGFPLLKEQKREEAILVICKNVMKFLDTLPKE